MTAINSLLSVGCGVESAVNIWQVSVKKPGLKNHLEEMCRKERCDDGRQPNENMEFLNLEKGQGLVGGSLSILPPYSLT